MVSFTFCQSNIFVALVKQMICIFSNNCGALRAFFTINQIYNRLNYRKTMWCLSRLAFLFFNKQTLAKVKPIMSHKAKSIIFLHIFTCEFDASAMSCNQINWKSDAKKKKKKKKAANPN